MESLDIVKLMVSTSPYRPFFPLGKVSITCDERKMKGK